jgi:hypothetical protein
MSEHPDPGGGSLDYVELVMASETALEQETLTPDQREWLIREIAERIRRGEFGDPPGFDGDDFAALVRKLGPRDPRGQAGAAAKPDESDLGSG